MADLPLPAISVNVDGTLTERWLVSSTLGEVRACQGDGSQRGVGYSQA